MTDDLLTTFRTEVRLPNEATARRTYARATSRHWSSSRRRLVVAITVASILLAAALSFVVIPSSGRSHSPPSGDPVQSLTMTPHQSDPVVSPIGLTLNVDVPNASVLELKVFRGPNEQGVNPPETGRLVFDETVPMTKVGPGLSRWAGKMSMNEWEGGCQNGYRYTITATVFDSSGLWLGLFGGVGPLTCSGN